MWARGPPGANPNSPAPENVIDAELNFVIPSGQLPRSGLEHLGPMPVGEKEVELSLDHVGGRRYVQCCGHLSAPSVVSVDGDETFLAQRVLRGEFPFWLSSTIAVSDV